MTTARGQAAVGRRGFLGALAGVSAAAATLTGAGPAEAEESPDERTKARYQESEHVKRFYAVNGYETRS